MSVSELQLTDIEAPPRRKSSAPPKLAGTGGGSPPTKFQVYSYKAFFVSIYFGLVAGLAFFLVIYYFFIWTPVRGNYSSHHIYIGHSSAVFHPE